MKCQKHFDGRKLPRTAKEQLRVAAVKRVEEGESAEEVAAGLGLNRRTIYRWLAAYHDGGEEALKSRPIRGKPPKLSAAQMTKLARIILTRPS
jgi:transposase